MSVRGAVPQRTDQTNRCEAHVEDDLWSVCSQVPLGNLELLHQSLVCRLRLQMTLAEQGGTLISGIFWIHFFFKQEEVKIRYPSLFMSVAGIYRLDFFMTYSERVDGTLRQTLKKQK